MKKQHYVPLIVSVVVVLDLLTKSMADARIEPLKPVRVLSFLSLVNVENTGAAFGMMSGLGNYFFIGVSLAAIGFIFYLLAWTRENPLSLSLIMGGALGNLYDRIALGHVRDFIYLSAGKYSWPAFNVADSALTVGLCLMLATTLISLKDYKKPGQ